MKKLLKLLFFVACLGLFMGCEKEEDLIENNSELKSGKYGADKLNVVKTVTLPFKADFVNTYVYVGPSPDPEIACGEWNPSSGLMWGLVIGEGGGNATHLGKFTHRFEFCCDFASGIYPGESGHMEAWFVSANGDSLFISVAGQVMDGRLDHHPEDVNSYFTDPWIITRGTGRFEGATGNGMTDDYNRDSYPDNSFHHWTGQIKMQIGKCK